jgi:hypothetical protein
MWLLARVDDPLQVVAAAVTPVVMVSATAILISGVNARYMAVSDRIRGLTHEFRDGHTSDQRRGVIQQQLKIFLRRLRLVAWAIRSLFAAAGCFVTMVLLISATLWRQMLAYATLPLFLVGLLLIIAAITCQLLELQASNNTINLEVNDVAPEPRT